jgi:hypothetical protein
MKKLMILFLVLITVGCEKELMDTEALGANAGIIGSWIENGYEEDVTLLERGDKLDPSKYGFTVEENGSFIERKNAGWCGTPPITYENFEGSWVALSDSLIEITVAYWGGTMSYQMRIVSLDDEELGIRYLYTNDWAEAR